MNVEVVLIALTYLYTMLITSPFFIPSLVCTLVSCVHKSSQKVPCPSNSILIAASSLYATWCSFTCGNAFTKRVAARPLAPATRLLATGTVKFRSADSTPCWILVTVAESIGCFASGSA